ncbi:MAG: pilus assembly protein [Pseudoxanthomonas suwonensis]|nr:pilus assembly protein [Pseudoxanthomonas suwonensis]
MTEFLVACVVLVPMFLLLPVVAKYAHIRQMSQQAARNVVWGAVAYPEHEMRGTGPVRATILARTFADADAPIRSDLANTATQGRFDSPMLRALGEQRLLERDNVHLASLRQQASPGWLSRVLGEGLELLPGAFPPNSDGYVRAEVRMDVRDLVTSDGRPARYLAPFDNLGLSVTSRQALLADAWNAGGPRQGRRSVRSQVRSLVPSSHLEGLQPVLDTVGALPLPILGRVDDLKIGTIEPDYVPHERLQPFPAGR